MRDDMSSNPATNDFSEVPGILICKLCQWKNSCWSKTYEKVSAVGFPGQKPAWIMFAKDIAGTVYWHSTQRNLDWLRSNLPENNNSDKCVCL